MWASEFADPPSPLQTSICLYTILHSGAEFTECIKCMLGGSFVASLQCTLRVLCRHVSSSNSKVRGGQSKGAAELAATWAKEYASCDRTMPSDVAGEQLRQVWWHAWQLLAVRYSHCVSRFHCYQAVPLGPCSQQS